MIGVGYGSDYGEMYLTLDDARKVANELNRLTK